MNFKAYLWTMTGATAIAWIAWLLVIFRMNQEETGILGLLLFYLTLFIACMGTFSVLGTFYRIKTKPQPLMSRETKTAVRHGILLSLLAVLTLLLSAHELLFWWNFFGLIILIGCIEYFFITLHSS